MRTLFIASRVRHRPCLPARDMNVRFRAGGVLSRLTSTLAGEELGRVALVFPCVRLAPRADRPIGGIPPASRQTTALGILFLMCAASLCFSFICSRDGSGPTGFWISASLREIWNSSSGSGGAASISLGSSVVAWSLPEASRFDDAVSIARCAPVMPQCAPSMPLELTGTPVVCVTDHEIRQSSAACIDRIGIHIAMSIGMKTMAHADRGLQLGVLAEQGGRTMAIKVGSGQARIATWSSGPLRSGPPPQGDRRRRGRSAS